MEIKIERAKILKEKPNQNNLGFGKYFVDHMFMMNYSVEKGWFDARIVPYGPISLSPASVCLHYGQEVFEGLKAYKTKTGEITLFRPEMNARRMQTSCERMCMAQLPEELFVEAVKQFVEFEKDWIPTEEGTSLYLRPFIFATEAAIGVHPSTEYLFMILACPVGNYYPEGINPVKIYVEEELVRASQGGTGFAKCGGNYAASILAQNRANAKGYSQVLWLDGVHRKYVEEVGTMNAMFIVDGKVYTSPIDGTVLPGVTRDSCLTLLKEWGYTICEEHFTIDFLVESAKNGKLQEAFGTGTAAVISPIGELSYRGEKIVINDFKTGEITQKLYDNLTGIQLGKIEDTHNWVVKVRK